MAKKDGILDDVVSAAVFGAAAKGLADLEKQAKEEGKDILEVAKEKAEGLISSISEDGKAEAALKGVTDKVGDVIEDLKSGELVDSITDKVNDVIEDAKSGKLLEELGDVANNVIEKVTSEEFKKEASETISNIKDGIIDIFDGPDKHN